MLVLLGVSILSQVTLFCIFASSSLHSTFFYETLLDRVQVAAKNDVSNDDEFDF
jgi:hypothetical protein